MANTTKPKLTVVGGTPQKLKFKLSGSLEQNLILAGQWRDRQVMSPPFRLHRW